MDIEPGVYTIYNKIFEPEKTHLRIFGRMMITHQGCVHLEDHFNAMKDLFPEGPITHTHRFSMIKLNNSIYFKIEKEDNSAVDALKKSGIF